MAMTFHYMRCGERCLPITAVNITTYNPQMPPTKKMLPSVFREKGSLGLCVVKLKQLELLGGAG